LEFHYTDLNKTYQILMTKEGSEVISENFKKYTTRIETPFTVWRAISRGEITGQDALFNRQYKVLGDFDVMLRWDDLFGIATATSSKNPAETSQKSQKTNMGLLLFPWIVIWSLGAINTTTGGVVGIVASVSLSLFWLFFRPVIYERLSMVAVSGFSLALLFGLDIRIIIPMSYGLFGLMWFISAFLKTPLTAYYSANNYGHDKAFQNQLFMKTNRILTAAWGILYLITPIWTYIIMGTDLSAYTGLINNVCPLFMGVFTIWFQKWYPASWAKG
jgi:hypothetical protein